MYKEKNFEITSATLHIMAMAFMLCDHQWGTIVPGNDWLTCIGRLAFPIFAFLLVEGVHHTRNRGRYMLRLSICALLAEIPYDLVVAGGISWQKQSIMVTLLLGFCAVILMEKCRSLA